MSNSYFQFKQFRIEQDRCAMKVGTDGVLLGAWTDVRQSKSILDIGTGTGLIALMLAQRSSAEITAIEIDEAATTQASDNFAGSPWASRITGIHTSLQDFRKGHNSLFDLIVSNPPYFNNSQKNPDSQKCMARHTDSLNYTELLSASTLLNEDGHFCVILPHSEGEKFSDIAKDYGLHPIRQTNIVPRIEAQPKRILLDLSKQVDSICNVNELLIEKGRHIYSPEFNEMTKDFYLDKTTQTNGHE